MAELVLDLTGVDENPIGPPMEPIDGGGIAKESNLLAPGSPWGNDSEVSAIQTSVRAFQPDQIITVIFGVMTSQFEWLGPAARCDPANGGSYYAFGGHTTADDDQGIRKCVNGVVSVIAGTGGASGFITGDRLDMHIYGDAVSTTIDIFLNLDPTPFVSWTDTTAPLTAGQPGAFIHDGSNNTNRISYFSADDLPGSSPIGLSGSFSLSGLSFLGAIDQHGVRDVVGGFSLAGLSFKGSANTFGIQQADGFFSLAGLSFKGAIIDDTKYARIYVGFDSMLTNIVGQNISFGD